MSSPLKFGFDWDREYFVPAPILWVHTLLRLRRIITPLVIYVVHPFAIFIVLKKSSMSADCKAGYVCHKVHIFGELFVYLTSVTHDLLRFLQRNSIPILHPRPAPIYILHWSSLQGCNLTRDPTGTRLNWTTRNTTVSGYSIVLHCCCRGSFPVSHIANASENALLW